MSLKIVSSMILKFLLTFKISGFVLNSCRVVRQFFAEKIEDFRTFFRVLIYFPNMTIFDVLFLFLKSVTTVTAIIENIVLNWCDVLGGYLLNSTEHSLLLENITSIRDPLILQGHFNELNSHQAKLASSSSKQNRDPEINCSHSPAGSHIFVNNLECGKKITIKCKPRQRLLNENKSERYLASHKKSRVHQHKNDSPYRYKISSPSSSSCRCKQNSEGKGFRKKKKPSSAKDTANPFLVSDGRKSLNCSLMSFYKEYEETENILLRHKRIFEHNCNVHLSNFMREIRNFDTSVLNQNTTQICKDDRPNSETSEVFSEANDFLMANCNKDFNLDAPVFKLETNLEDSDSYDLEPVSEITYLVNGTDVGVSNSFQTGEQNSSKPSKDIRCFEKEFEGNTSKRVETTKSEKLDENLSKRTSSIRLFFDKNDCLDFEFVDNEGEDVEVGDEKMRKLSEIVEPKICEDINANQETIETIPSAAKNEVSPKNKGMECAELSELCAGLTWSELCENNNYLPRIESEADYKLRLEVMAEISNEQNVVTDGMSDLSRDLARETYQIINDFADDEYKINKKSSRQPPNIRCCRGLFFDENSEDNDELLSTS